MAHSFLARLRGNADDPVNRRLVRASLLLVVAGFALASASEAFTAAGAYDLWREWHPPTPDGDHPRLNADPAFSDPARLAGGWGWDLSAWGVLALVVLALLHRTSEGVRRGVRIGLALFALNVVLDLALRWTRAVEPHGLAHYILQGTPGPAALLAVAWASRPARPVAVPGFLCVAARAPLLHLMGREYVRASGLGTLLGPDPLFMAAPFVAGALGTLLFAAAFLAMAGPPWLKPGRGQEVPGHA